MSASKRSGLPALAGACAVFMLLTPSAVRAEEEGCRYGPSNIYAVNDWTASITVPKGQSVRFSFTFNALWENMLFICEVPNQNPIAVRGNYGRNSADFVPSGFAGSDHTYIIVAFHKKTSPDDRNAPRYKWRQSPMKILKMNVGEEPEGSRLTTIHSQFGFNDEGGDSYTNAVVTVSYRNQVGVIFQRLFLPPMSIGSRCLKWCE
jgi:hypothetical protein